MLNILLMVSGVITVAACLFDIILDDEGPEFFATGLLLLVGVVVFLTGIIGLTNSSDEDKNSNKDPRVGVVYIAGSNVTKVCDGKDLVYDGSYSDVIVNSPQCQPGK